MTAGQPDGRLDLVHALVDSAAGVQEWLASGWLDRLTFDQVDDLQSDRLVRGPAGRLYAARHRFRTWETAGGARLSWFSLESEIPHMSSIVACIAQPVDVGRCPLFVMNLNLKLKAGTYNTIMGFRGPPGGLGLFRGTVPGPAHGPMPEPALAKAEPSDFSGVRYMFWLDRAPIGWSVEVARSALDRWFTAVAALPDRSGSGRASRDRRYAAEMTALHGREGGVYDAVFGDGWLLSLFTDRVFRSEV